MIIGLTVNKTEELFRKADSFHSIKKVLNICSLEKLTATKKRCKWFPKTFQLEKLQLLKKLEKKANKQAKKRKNTGSVPTDWQWEVCVYRNDLEQRTIPWSKKITHLQAVKYEHEETSHFKVHIYNKHLSKPTKYTGQTIPFELVQETVKLIQEMRENKDENRMQMSTIESIKKIIEGAK